MRKKYNILLFFSFLLCLIPSLSIYYYNIEDFTYETIESTVYDFKEVNFPIQPIPQNIKIDKNWVSLGKALFHSPMLSKNNSISCSSCHMVDFGGDDGMALSTGINNLLGNRNSPTVLNSVFNFKQFWDGRAADLTEQVAGPIHNPVEMGSSWDEIIKKLKRDPYFYKAFMDISKNGVNEENILKAIVTYEESLITPNAPIDLYLLGDSDALTKQQKRGLDLFVNYGCSTCHQGVNIGGNIYQKFGMLNDVPEEFKADLGKYIISKKESDKFVFKVPSLRNIAQTSPYFHNGSVHELSEAVIIMAESQLGIQLSTSEVEDIVALLQSFSANLVKL